MPHELYIPGQRLNPILPALREDLQAPGIADIKISFVRTQIHYHSIPEPESFNSIHGYLMSGGAFLNNEIVPTKAQVIGKEYSSISQKKIMLAYGLWAGPFGSTTQQGYLIELMGLKTALSDLNGLSGDWKVRIARIFKGSEKDVGFAFERMTYDAEASLLEQTASVAHWAELSKPAKILGF